MCGIVVAPREGKKGRREDSLGGGLSIENCPSARVVSQPKDEGERASLMEDHRPNSCEFCVTKVANLDQREA
ncbi:hypothetical protein HZH66_009803 [Vespula vulgaris]|uniref:Uncharacterized protein n=2 Tax=Vespula TaxID=7451 RepID=A0A834NSH7_VESPE|nr:hypothetical protein HZH66_009803 [Vespula vulgaris]KAF7417247.1 hypothetical protein H0235_011778 [Vespula pensylvanica]